ncbi:hypothetical protein Tco_1336608 [Tanacetum coccineum]
MIILLVQKAVVNAVSPKAVVNAVKEFKNGFPGCKERIDSGLSRAHDKETCPYLLTLKKLMEDMLLFEVDYYQLYTSFSIRPFGCLVTILNTKDDLGKFDGKADEGTKASDNEVQARKETEPVKDYILLPLWTADPPFSQDPKSSQDDGSKPSSDDGKKVDEDLRKDSKGINQDKEDNVNSTNNVNAASTNEVNVVGGKTSIKLLVDPDMLSLEDISIFYLSNDDEDVDAEADMNNLDTSIQVSPILTTRIHKDHPLNQVIGDLQSATQTRRMSKNLEEYRFTEVKTASTPIETQKPLLKDEDGEERYGVYACRMVGKGFMREISVV